MSWLFSIRYVYLALLVLVSAAFVYFAAVRDA
jgi:hypothetical protein